MTLPITLQIAINRVKQASKPDVMWQQASQSGLTGLLLSPEWGGLDQDYVTYIAVLRALAQHSAGFAVCLSVHLSVAVLPLLQHGTEKQKTFWLPHLSCGEVMGAFALTEPNAGSDAQSARLAATLTDTGLYRLYGEKQFITNALTAGLFVLMAKTPHLGDRAMTAFLIPAKTPGFFINPGGPKLGLKDSNWGSLSLEICDLPANTVLGQPGQGFTLARDALVGGRIGIAAISLGLADRCLALAAQTRPDATDVLGAMAARLAAAEVLVRQATERRQQERPCLVEAAMAKLAASEAATWLAEQASQLLGLAATYPEHPVAQAVVDAKAMEIVEGTSQVQRLLIAKHLL